MGKKGSLARQLLVLQLLSVLVLLVAVAAVSLAQVGQSFRDTEGRRMLGLAEDVAANQGLRFSLADRARHEMLAPFAESARSQSGASFVIIARPDRTVLTSPDPRQNGEPLPIGDSTITSGRSWVGEVDGAMVAHVPVMGLAGDVIGIVAAGQDLPSVWQAMVDSPADVLVLLGIATALGVVGSFWLAWWVKRQTLGLEPAEITGLVEHREAMLHGIREGVVGLDPQHRITLVNDQARTLLSLPDRVVGSAVADLDLNGRLLDVLTGRAAGSDQIVLRKGRVLVMNRVPISIGTRGLGAVVTLRDRTELVRLRDELAANRNITDTLRAQAHEFSNRLHTISGLIELGEYDEVRRFVTRVSTTMDRWHAEVSTRIADPSVAALLIAKASLAAEQGVDLRLADSARLGEVDERLSADLVTVLGNLVDNALDALPGPGGWIEVDVAHTEVVRVVVRDSGPGVAPDLAEEIFRNGFTTKAAEEGGQRGLGLALTRQACVRRSGSVTVHNADGAVFTATLPVTP
ncbi:Signal transduction histidine kinase CitA regulating citrate metabolism [Alloactinosynnema sp. L-07]|uniref:sensor histidine kinase n=1 Tax=Alloactinosynnema sp. L-07 TaxID=1653480 RepID=UPI00065EEFFE|nr:sensor histidine kinase [Alloactinosynnema sp. L-07]CRK56076.1 Signal transduction histidine kinase CitA regulating citrate metabolism [Alloactinosynnema sp. L-07]